MLHHTVIYANTAAAPTARATTDISEAGEPAPVLGGGGGDERVAGVGLGEARGVPAVGAGAGEAGAGEAGAGEAGAGGAGTGAAGAGAVAVVGRGVDWGAAALQAVELMVGAAAAPEKHAPCGKEKGVQ
ncbi:unnamed protein product [Closterium sp. Naga37s-1]|nr:unnamed protein product [Closterium sp. Naga37s-1]